MYRDKKHGVPRVLAAIVAKVGGLNFKILELDSALPSPTPFQRGFVSH